MKRNEFDEVFSFRWFAPSVIREVGCFLPNAKVLILTDQSEFARLLTASWQTARPVPGITVVGSDLWKEGPDLTHDLVIVGPLREEKASSLLKSLDPGSAVILCVPVDSREGARLRSRYPRIIHVPMREDWAQTVLLVASESLRRVEAQRMARQAELSSVRNEQHATLGRYMSDMRNGVNDALTSLLGNAELLMLEPGQLSKVSLGQIKTIHSMALRINEVMQRFSSLASEMRESEIASQAETPSTETVVSSRR